MSDDDKKAFLKQAFDKYVPVGQTELSHDNLKELLALMRWDFDAATVIKEMDGAGSGAIGWDAFNGWCEAHGSKIWSDDASEARGRGKAVSLT